MPATRVGPRGQITIPKQIRQALQLREGDRVAFVAHGEDVVLKPIRATLRDHRGSVPVAAEQDFDAVRRAVRQTRARRHTAAPSGDTDAG